MKVIVFDTERWTAIELQNVPQRLFKKTMSGIALMNRIATVFKSRLVRKLSQTEAV